MTGFRYFGSTKVLRTGVQVDANVMAGGGLVGIVTDGGLIMPQSAPSLMM